MRGLLRDDPNFGCEGDYSQPGNPKTVKTLTPDPRTPTTNRVRGLPTDRSTDYPYGPLYGPPAK